MKNSFYITTTLPYVNSNLHMGHALEFIRADAIARVKKLQGFEVFFNTGTDEHGMKIYEKAISENKTAQQFVDESFLSFKESVKIFGMDEEDLHFIRTTDEHHIKSAQEFWKRVYDNGFIYKKNYEAKYCVGCEEIKSDGEIVNNECPIHTGRPLEIIQEENYFFKYSEFGDKLLKFYEANPKFVVPDFRFNEIKAFIGRGLQDFSISRLKTKMPWGIAVPNDPDHVMYVWFDALINYISTLGWPENDKETEGKFEKFWVHGTPTQYCGKDNTRFQSAMWQAMLMAANLPNSHQVVVNGFITADGGIKMSKSLGNVVDPKDIVKEYGTEALRYFLLREVSPFEDSPFTLDRFKESYNSGLANGLGNLVSRVMKMAELSNISIEPPDVENLFITNPFNIKDNSFVDAVNSFDLKKAIDSVWLHIRYIDELIQKKEPFKLLKSTDKEEKKNGTLLLIDMLRDLFYIAAYLKPFMPETSAKIMYFITENKMPETPLFLRKN